MMRSRIPSILLITLTLVTVAFSTICPAMAQTKPEFKLGFKTLADQIPYAVGEPTENERWGANGDSLQQTTTGLMVWRKADNWTAFTDGGRTWINGPSGVQDRSNDDRFDWEGQTPRLQSISLASSAWLMGQGAVADAPIRGEIDSPKDGERVRDTLRIAGWATDSRGDPKPFAVSEFSVFVDGPEGSGRRISGGVDHTQRLDIAQALGDPVYASSGFEVHGRLDGVPEGSHDVYFYAHSSRYGWWYKKLTVFVESLPAGSSRVPSSQSAPPTPTLAPTARPATPTPTPSPSTSGFLAPKLPVDVGLGFEIRLMQRYSPPNGSYFASGSTTYWEEAVVQNTSTLSAAEIQLYSFIVQGDAVSEKLEDQYRLNRLDAKKADMQMVHSWGPTMENATLSMANGAREKAWRDGKKYLRGYYLTWKWQRPDGTVSERVRSLPFITHDSGW
jgi:hypothetical protein